MANIRIKDQTTVTTLQAGDYVIVDTEASGVGTRKFDLGSALSGGSGSGLTDTEKSLILTLFNQAAYAENDAGTAYNQLSNMWSGYSITWSGSGYTHSNNSSSITGGSTFTSTVSASSGFTITGVVATMGGNTVQGAWNNGTVTIPNVTGNIVITVTTAQATVSSISAVYTQSGTVHDTDSLDSLKSDLVVTATYVDQSTYVVPAAEYTLSGTLAEGTSTVTVTYGGKTDTFNVTVTPSVIILDITTGLIPNVYLTTSGTESSYSGWSATDFIDVSQYTEIQIYTDSGLTGTFKQNYCHWYNSEKTRTATLAFGVQSGSLSADTSTGWISIPSGSTYFRLSDVTGNISNYIHVKAQ